MITNLSLSEFLRRLANDRFNPELGNHGMSAERERGFRDGWNSAIDHVRELAEAVRK